MSRVEAHVGTSRAQALAQPWADDVVLAASLFKPNAGGNFELSWSGFGQRQILKARGVYLAERVILGVTALDVHALQLMLGRWIVRPLGRWSRSDLHVESVKACGARDPRTPALLIANRARELAELQVMEFDDQAALLVKLLLRHEGREHGRDR